MYKYEVITSNVYKSRFIVDLLRIHGLLYSWEALKDNLNNEVLIRIYSADKYFELIFCSDSSEVAQKYGIKIDRINCPIGWYKLSYLEHHILSLPLWNNCFFSALSLASDNTKSLCFLKKQR